MARYPDAVRRHVVEARRAGARVKDLAETLGVSPQLISYWARTAGVDPSPREQMGRPCQVCAHPSREAVEVALITMTVTAVADQFPALTDQVLDRHRRLHLGLAGLGQHAAHRPCRVCDHAQRDAIDQVLEARGSRTRLEEATGIPRHVLRHHQEHHLNNLERDATKAAAAIRRLTAIRAIIDADEG